MALEKIASLDACENLNCPGIWRDTETGHIEVQGLTVTTVGLPGGESRVRITGAEFDALIDRYLA